MIRNTRAAPGRSKRHGQPRTAVVAVLSLVLASLALAACGPTAAPTPAATPAGATTPAAPTGTVGPTASPSPAAIEELDPGVVSDEWLILDREAATYSLTEEHPERWEPVFRKASESYRFAWGSQSETIAFGVDVSRGVQDAASQAGIELLSLNNDWPATDKPIEVAETVALQKPDFFINFNAIVAIYPRIQQIVREAGVPTLTITFKNPDTPVFGADNYTVGVLAGRYLAKYAADRDWPQEEIHVVACDDLRLGAFVRARVDGFFFGMNQDAPLVPPAQYTRLDCQDPEGSQRLMTDWLTANPGAKYIVMSGISDFRVVAMANALKSAGRDENAAGLGQGLDDSSKEIVRSGDPKAFVGAVAFFPEQYGKFAVTMALDALEGKPVPASVSPNHVVIDASNIDEYYPAP